ncbi:MAG: C39 family peptidase [bacterium]
MATRSKIFSEPNTTLIPNLEAKAPIITQQGGSCTVYSASVAFRLHGANRLWFSDWLLIWQASYDAACKKAGKILDRDSYSNTMSDVFEFYKKLGLCTGFKELTGGYTQIVDQITSELKAGNPVHFGIGISQIPYELYYTITQSMWKPRDLQQRTHELAIVGFDEKYFYIQNSYGVDNQHAEGKGYFRIEKEIIKYNGFGFCVFYFDNAEEKPVEPEKPPTPEPKKEITTMITLPEVYNQRDQRWAGENLGYSNTTIAAYGCLLNCLAMVARYYGINETPVTLDKKLEGIGGYYGGNMYVWGKLQQLFPDIEEKHVLTPNRLTDLQITDIKRALDSGYPVMLEIDFNTSTTTEDMHFVLATGYQGEDFTIADPWTGKLTTLAKAGYIGRTKPSARDAIYQYMTLKGKVPTTNTPKYEAVAKGQKFALVGFQPSIRFTIQNVGTETLIDDTVRLFFRKDKNVVNPSNVDYSVFFAGKDGVKLELLDQASRTYTATIPLNVKIGIPKGVYREDWGLATTGTREWVTTWNGWFEVEVV